MRERRSPFPWVLGTLILVALAGSAGCPNDVRDSHCTPDAPGFADDPDCIYTGEGNGPKVSEPLCPELTGSVPAVCPNFEQVFQVLIDPARGNCSAGGCHGVLPGSIGIYLPVSDTGLFYEQLTQTAGSAGRLYVVPDNPATPENESLKSTIVCNLSGARGGGFPMPIPSGMPDLADVALVQDWVLCGAPGPRCAPETDDSACALCAKRACCDEVEVCRGDAEGAPCWTCVDGAVSYADCAAECPTADPEILAFDTCLADKCATECTGG